MAWSISISAEGWEEIYEACHSCTKGFLLEAINEAAEQNNTGSISDAAAKQMGQESLADIAYQLIQATKTCDNGGFQYWIDPKGYYKIAI